MIPEQKAAYAISQSVCAMIEAMGMAATNQRSVLEGKGPVYMRADFEAVIIKYGIHHNSIHEYCFVP